MYADNLLGAREKPLRLPLINGYLSQKAKKDEIRLKKEFNNTTPKGDKKGTSQSPRLHQKANFLIKSHFLQT
jgi:hypothetical protein